MIQSLLLLIALSQLVCGLANAGESAKINLDNISFIKICQNPPQLPPGQRPSGPAAAGGYFISGWTKSGKVQFVKTNEEILEKADQLPIDTSWRWQQTLYNNDGFVKSRFPYSVHASTKPVLSEP